MSLYKKSYKEKVIAKDKPTTFMRSRPLILCIFIYALFWIKPGFSVSIIEHAEEQGPFSPWFTGPLLAPAGSVVPSDHFNVQPYYFHTTVSGEYGRNWHYQSIDKIYTNVFQVVAQIPVVPKVGFAISPQIIWNTMHGHTSFGFGDLPMMLAFQLIPASQETWKPALKLGLGVIAPVGKFDNLDPNRYNTDGTGLGSWFPNASLVSAFTIQLGQSIHFLSIRLATAYIIGTSAHVKKNNTYGGDLTTDGWVYPGNLFKVDISLECNLSQKWALAMDTLYIHNNKTRFSGKTKASMRIPSGEQFSIAPALEYNFNNNIGLIGGAWITLGGRNAAQFISGVISINVYH
ncbi:MAG: hypothetical protein NT065_04895 [Chlamydiae bacterium]|nr:hypothetical protein [Chlamydiota bacterium]